MRTKAQLFQEATEKNALRRSSGLPLLDIREEMAFQAYIDQADRYHDAWERHKHVLRRMEAEELAAMQAARPQFTGQGMAGHMAVHYRARPRYVAFLATLGFIEPSNPRSRHIRYGGDKK